jgi:hypothetical protein
MVTICKRAVEDGTWYEVKDFPAYAEALRQRTVEAPEVNYRVFLSSTTERAVRAAGQDVEGQVARFFRIGPAFHIPFRVIDL